MDIIQFVAPVSRIQLIIFLFMLFCSRIIPDMFTRISEVDNVSDLPNILSIYSYCSFEKALLPDNVSEADVEPLVDPIVEFLYEAL